MPNIVIGDIKCKHCDLYAQLHFMNNEYGYCKMRDCMVRARARAQKCFHNSDIVLTVRQRSYFNRK